jgi:hypothetical protein
LTVFDLQDEPTISGLTFTGDVSELKNTTSGKAATNMNFQTGDTADLTYTIRSTGDTSKVQNYYWQVGSKYILMLPAGFKLATPWQSGDFYTITDLGKVGNNGEWAYLATLSKTPYYGIPLSLTAHMTATSDLAGTHQYSGQSLPSLLMAVNDNGIFKGSNSIVLGGQIYTVDNCSQFIGDNPLNYKIIPGSTSLNSSKYTVTSIEHSVHDVTGAGNRGYEEIDPTIQINGQVNAGDYIDFRLGIPYKDNSGQTQYLMYDSSLSKSFDLESGVGTVYNMGDYYRLVFNSTASRLSNLQVKLQLKWGSDSNQASLNANKSYVYQKTNDATKNGTTFQYTPTDDLMINGQRFASGFTVTGTYVDPAVKSDTANHNASYETIGSVNRTWNNRGTVVITTDWYNSEAAELSTDVLGNEFDLKIAVHLDPTGQITYSYDSPEELAQAIENEVVAPDTQLPANQLVNDAALYATVNKTAGQKPTVHVSVTRTITTDPSDQDTQIVTYHVKLTTPDDPAAKILLKGAIRPVTASANSFTMPTDIKSYQADLAAAHTVQNANYGGGNDDVNAAKTSNEALMKALQTVKPFSGQFITYKNGQKTSSGVWGGPWQATIRTVGNNDLTGGGDVSALVTATLSFEDVDSGQKLSSDIQDQSFWANQIKFSGAQNAYSQLSGYQFVKAVSVLDGQQTTLINFDPTKIGSYDFGKLSSNGPTQFIIYLKRTSSQQKATLKFVDDDENGTSLAGELTASGDSNTPITFMDVNSQIDKLKQKHYELAKVTNDNTHATLSGTDWATIFGAFDSDTKTDQAFTIHFKHATMPVDGRSKTVTETIHYKYADGHQGQAHSDYTKKLTFKQSRTKDLVTNKTSYGKWTAPQSFDAVPSPTIAGYTPDIATVPEQTVTVTNDNYNSNLNIIKTVTYNENKKADQQTASLNFLDDTTGENIHPALTTSGDSGAAIVFSSIGNLINQFEQHHYQLAKTTNDNIHATLSGADWSTIFGTFDSDTKTNQDFTIHFKHETTPISRTKTVTETIHYRYDNGQQAAKNHTQVLPFEGTGSRDLVLQKDGPLSWHLEGTTTDQGDFKAVVNPSIAGYHVASAKGANGQNVLDPATNSVKALQGVNHQSADQVVTVVYAADSVPAQSTSPSSQASTPSAQPTNPSSQASTPSAQPTNPSSQATTSSAQPTNPSSQASAPATQPTEQPMNPNSQASTPTEQPTAPSAQPTNPGSQSSAQPTAPDSQVSEQPISQPTAPSTSTPNSSTQSSVPSIPTTTPSASLSQSGQPTQPAVRNSAPQLATHKPSQLSSDPAVKTPLLGVATNANNKQKLPQTGNHTSAWVCVGLLLGAAGLIGLLGSRKRL